MFLNQILLNFLLFLVLTKEFGIKDIQGRPYHPQTHGQVERKNQTIKKAVCYFFKWYYKFNFF